MKYLSFGLMMCLLACSPTVKVAAPDKPIEINLNINIEHKVRVQIDQDLDNLFDEESDLF